MIYIRSRFFIPSALLCAFSGYINGISAARSWQGYSKTDGKNPVISKAGIAFHAAAEIPIIHKRTTPQNPTR